MSSPLVVLSTKKNEMITGRPSAGVPQPALPLPIVLRQAELPCDLLGGGIRLGHGVRAVGDPVVGGLQHTRDHEQSIFKGCPADWNLEATRCLGDFGK